MRTAIRMIALVALFVGSASTGLAADKFSGYVIKLAEKTNMTEPQSVNVGGLVIAVVRDSGSRPPQGIAVVASAGLQPLGTVRGVQNDQGQALMGGGYTWHLFQAAKPGDAKVNVAYTENGDNGKKVERAFSLIIE